MSFSNISIQTTLYFSKNISCFTLYGNDIQLQLDLSFETTTRCSYEGSSIKVLIGHYDGTGTTNVIVIDAVDRPRQDTHSTIRCIAALDRRNLQQQQWRFLLVTLFVGLVFVGLSGLLFYYSNLDSLRSLLVVRQGYWLSTTSQRCRYLGVQTYWNCHDTTFLDPIKTPTTKRQRKRHRTSNDKRTRYEEEPIAESRICNNRFLFSGLVNMY